MYFRKANIIYRKEVIETLVWLHDKVTKSPKYVVRCHKHSVVETVNNKQQQVQGHEAQDTETMFAVESTLDYILR